MSLPDQVWIVDDDKSIRWVLEKALHKAQIDTRCFANADELLKDLNHSCPQVLITDIRMPGMDGFELLQKLQQEHPTLPVIIMTAHSDLESAVSAFHGGAFEYLPKPFDVNEVVDTVQRACIHSKQQNLQPSQEVIEETPEIIGEAPAMQEVFRAIGRLARSHITVLINGESGTGKELVAKALHRHSPRANEPFIALNMAAIPKDLMESELFGHEKAHSPAHRHDASVVSNKPTMAPCSSMKSATCRQTCKPACYEYWQTMSSIRLALIRPSRSMYASSPRPIKT